MKYYQAVASLIDKDQYKTALVIRGEREGMHAVFSKDAVTYAEGSIDFWQEVFEQSKTLESYNSVLSINNELVYLEKLSEQMRLVICGAGHVSIPIIKIAKMLGFWVTVIDDRFEFAQNARTAGADEVVCDDFCNALQTLKGDCHTFFAIVTRGHRHDRACLEKILYKENAYIGMIGSKARVAKQFSDMINDGFPEDLLSAVHSPIGLNIGSQTPEEIAVSVMAEIIQVKNSRVKTSGYDKKMLLILAGRHPDYQGKEMALATIIDKQGSGPREVGTKMLVFDNGSIVGTIGGGKLELDVISWAVACIREQKNRLFQYDMSLKEAEEEGMACGGSALIYIEVVRI